MSLAAPPEPDHLGGYVPGGDPATWYTRLWRELAGGLTRPGLEPLPPVTSMIDVGAGPGWACEFFAMLNVDAVGVEGTEQTNDLVIQHDYADGPYDPGREFDLGWTCEFVEHVDPAFEPNYLATLARCRMVLMTHGEPGQPGHHHVNLHLAPYWVARLASVGLEWDERLTIRTRELAAVNPSPWNHYKRSGLAFRRVDRDRPVKPPKPPANPSNTLTRARQADVGYLADGAEGRTSDVRAIDQLAAPAGPQWMPAPRPR